MKSYFWDDLDRWGSRPALASEDEAPVSYAQLARFADDFAARIGKTRQLVALDACNDVRSIVALMACLRNGHPVILTSEATKSRIIDKFMPNVVIDGQGNVSRHSDVVHEMHEDLALLLSTSGSTGATKLVRLSHRAIHANAAAIAEYLALGPDEVAITTLPMAYSYGLSVITSHLLSGARIVLTDRSVIDDDFWKLFSREGATSLAGVPRTYELLEATGFRARNLPSLRTLTQAGGALDPQLRATYSRWAKRKGVGFFVMYGQTEATARIAYLPPELQDDHGDCVGRVIPGGELRLVNGDGTAVSSGETGELVYSGPNVMMGYATSAHDLRLGRTVDDLKTGDLAQQAAPGIYRIVGRLSRFSKIAGLRVSLDEIDALLAEHGIRSHVAGDDALVAICLEREEDREAARLLLDQHTALPAGSRVVFALATTPRLASGKPDYPAILQAGRAARQERLGGAESGEGAVAASYASALNLPSVAGSDSFASLGGDSLAYIEVALAIERSLGYLPDHWERLSISQIEQLAPKLPQEDGARRWVTVETEVLIRPLAITAILMGHAIAAINPSAYFGFGTWTGGALVLLMAAGYNTCRFQKGRLLATDRLSVIGNYLKRIAAPYYVLIITKALFPIKSGYVALASFFLVNNYYYDSNPDANQRYWFIEALFQSLAVMSLLFAVPVVRQAAKQRAFAFALGLTAAFFAIKLLAAAVLPPAMESYLGLRWDAWAYAFAIGWAVAEATTTGQRLTCLVIAIAASGYDWGFVNSHTVYLASAVGLILFLPKGKLPGPAAQVLTFWARSTLFIYLSHGFVMSVYERVATEQSILLYVLLSTVAGWLFFLAWRTTEKLVLPQLGQAVRRAMKLLRNWKPARPLGSRAREQSAGGAAR